MAANEEQLLRQFLDSGSRDALRELLIAHQGRVYNACYQVLTRAQDAEDAAQEALLKLPEGARTSRDADAFRGWIYRVSFRIALDHWRRREAVKNRELRAAMNRPVAAPLDDRERIALFEAMDGLDDRERSLLLEHYFEKVSLAELGDRQGISAVAIWKRIDRAREKLKKTLLGAGFAVATSRVSEALEASVPAAAPPSLVGEAILGKILAGGLAVGATKGSITATAVAVLLLGLALAGWRVFSSKELVKPSSRQHGNFATSPKDSVQAAGVPATHDAPPAAPAGKEAGLRETLQRYKAWVANWKAERVDSNRSHDFRSQARREFKGARALILEDPGTFLEFLQDPANEEVSETLTGDLLFQLEEREGKQVIVRHPFGAFPIALMEGVSALVKKGPANQKTDVLMFLCSVDDLPQELNQTISELLGDSDSQVQYWAVCVLASQRRPLGPAIESRLMERCIFRGESDLKQFAIQAVSHSENPETRAWMISSLEGNRDPELLPALAEGSVTMALRSKGETGVLDRVADLLIHSLKSDLQEAHAERILVSVLRLPTAQATRILQAAQFKGLAPRLVAAISEVLNLIGRGQSTPQELQSAFTGAMEASRAK